MISYTMAKYIHRVISSKIEEAIRYYPVITITGPRQSGKSTLCRHLFPDYNYVSLERIPVRSVASEDPESFINSLGKRAIIDEVQHVPSLLSEIQCRVDEDKSLKYVLTGSSNFSLMESVTQSLAGRTALFTLLPLSEEETRGYSHQTDTNTILYNGCYPGVLIEGVLPELFYANYYDTYVERDLRNLLKVSNIAAFDKFVHMLALRVGSEFNATAISREVGVTTATILEWLTILQTSYIVFKLTPFYNNPNKRLTKTPKVYFHDTGLLCYLLKIERSIDLEAFPFKGQIFENYVVAEMMKEEANQCKRNRLFYYRESQGLEIDILRQRGIDIDLYEIKSGATYHPVYLKNMNTLSNRLPNVKSKTVIYDGESITQRILNFRDL